MASTSSIFWMYSLFNSATHHIFFPPRFQLVALQQDPNCLSSHIRDQLALDGLFGDQADSPASPAFRRLAADHGDNALFLGVVENLLRSRSLFCRRGRDPGRYCCSGGRSSGWPWESGELLARLEVRSPSRPVVEAPVRVGRRVLAQHHLAIADQSERDPWT